MIRPSATVSGNGAPAVTLWFRGYRHPEITAAGESGAGRGDMKLSGVR